MARYISKAQIISSIHEAFKGVPCPEKVTLHVAAAHDVYDYAHDDIQTMTGVDFLYLLKNKS